jgi:hypothetical protein
LKKLDECLKSKKMSPFDFFTTLDVNSNGSITKIELKTGMQSLGIEMSGDEYRQLWKMLKKPAKKIGVKGASQEGEEDEGRKGSGRNQTSSEDSKKKKGDT